MKFMILGCIMSKIYYIKSQKFLNCEFKIGYNIDDISVLNRLSQNLV